MWQEKLQDTAASHPWLEPHEAIKRKTQAPEMQLVDWYGFTVPKTKKEMFLKQSARREDLLVVGEVDNIHSFFSDYETEWRSNILFDDLDEALRYCEDVRSGFISDIQLHSSFIMYKEPGFKAMPGGGFAGWSDLFYAARGNLEYANKLLFDCQAGDRDGMDPRRCAREDLINGVIAEFGSEYVMTGDVGQKNRLNSAEILRIELNSVPTDGNGHITGYFHGYPIGTFREDIWHDIEDQLGVPIHELMFPDDVNKDMTNERSLTMSNENKNTNVKEETTWTNFKFFNNQVKLKVIEKDDRQMYLADCRFMPGSVANGIDLGDQNGISGHMTVFLTEKQYFKAAEQKANGEQINVGLPSTQLKDGKLEVNFYNHESKEAHTIQVNPFAASKANKAAREAFFERKDAEREQGKGLGAKAASARDASEKLDGQSQVAPAKDNLEH